MAILFVVKCKLTVLFATNECDLTPLYHAHKFGKQKKKLFLEGLQTPILPLDPPVAAFRYINRTTGASNHYTFAARLSPFC